MYLVARGPGAQTITLGHDDDSLDWELTVAPLGSPPTEVPARPAHIQKEIREWYARTSSFREANATGEPLTPFPAPDLALLERHRKTRQNSAALAAALDGASEAPEAIAVLLAALREKWGDRWTAEALRRIWMAEHDYQVYWAELDPVEIPGHVSPDGSRSIRPASHLPRGLRRAAETAKKVGWPILASPSFQRDVAGGKHEKANLLRCGGKLEKSKRKSLHKKIDRLAAALGVSLLSNPSPGRPSKPK